MSLLFQSELAAGVRGVSFAEAWSRMELEFELTRARAGHSGLVRFAIERFEKFPESRRSAVCIALGELVRARLPRAAAVAALRASELVVFLPGSDAAETEAFARTLVTEARKLAITGENAPVRVGLNAGLAATRAGIDAWFETLDAVAGEGVEVASAQGGSSCVHSELYELHQRRIERTKGPRSAPPPLPAAAATQLAARANTTTTQRQSEPTAPAPRAPARTEPAHAANAAPETLLHALLPNAADVPGLDLAQVEAKVLELARAAFERALADQAKQFQSQLDLYERRITKMQSALAETENERDRLARTKTIDAGIASTYRGVQGLSLDDEASDPRVGMLRAIAESNLVLRAQLGRKTA